MGRQAPFDERIAVVNLILDYLDGQLIRYERTDRNATALHQALDTFKLFMKDRADMECLSDFIQSRREALRVKKEAGVISVQEEDAERWVLSRLAEYELTLKAVSVRDKAEGFLQIKALFQKEVAWRAELVKAVKAQLDRAFAFLTDCFGDGQEIILFMSALTRLERGMDFICLHGCEPYLRCSRRLLYREREQTLRSACGEVLGDISL